MLFAIKLLTMILFDNLKLVNDFFKYGAILFNAMFGNSEMPLPRTACKSRQIKVFYYYPGGLRQCRQNIFRHSRFRL